MFENAITNQLSMHKIIFQKEEHTQKKKMLRCLKNFRHDKSQIF